MTAIAQRVRVAAMPYYDDDDREYGEHLAKGWWVEWTIFAIVALILAWLFFTR